MTDQVEHSSRKEHMRDLVLISIIQCTAYKSGLNNRNQKETQMLAGNMRDIRITANTTEIVAILKKNLELHRAEHKEAMEGWNEKLSELAAKVAEDGKANKITEGPKELAGVIHNQPQDHSDTYEAAIELFGHHKEETIVLSSGDCEKLLRNNWEWTENWMVTNRMYKKVI